MEFNQNRLRFVHCEHLFNNIDEIKNYVRSVQYERASLYAEPMIFKYGDKKNPCIVLAIGSVGEGKFVYDTETGDVLNETFYIDFSQVEKDIEDIRKEFGENGSITKLVENIISSCGLDENGNYVSDFKDKIIGEATSLFVADKMLSEYVIALEKKHELYVKDTNTVDLTSEKSESGVTLLADVKLGSKIYDGRVIENIIEKQDDGIFTSVDLDFFEEESKLVLTINGDDKKDIKLPKESHVIKGEYDTYTESLILTLSNEIDIEGELSNKISINLAKLIEEWTVLGESSDTPIVLTKEQVSANDTVHKGIYEYQDILKADVRILDKVTKPDNILMKDSSGKFLYVDGVASNISYLRNNEKITVQKGLDEKISKTDYSKQDDSVITYRQDGLYSHIDMRYDSSSNKIIFEKSDKDGIIHKFEYELNSLSLFSKAYWDATTEEVVIQYVDATNDIQEIRIPIKLVVDQLDVDNSDRTITLTLVKNDNGIDKLSADVNISLEADNILQDTHHSLYVKGTADNIKMGNKTLGETVENAINAININYQYELNEESKLRENEDRNLLNIINKEIIDARKNEHDLLDLINSITDNEDYNSKFDELHETDIEIKEDLINEINRSKEEDIRIENKLDSNIKDFEDKINELDSSIEKEILERRDSDRTFREDLTRFNDAYKVYTSTTTNSLNNEINRSIVNDDTLDKKIDNEVYRSMAREDELADRIFHLSADTNCMVSESGTLKLSKEKQTIGYLLKGDVKVSTQQFNLLNNDGEPLYAYVDIVYNDSKNQLTLKRSGNNVDKVIDLNVGSLIDTITLDEKTNELVIICKDASKNEHESRVDLTKLFNDFDVDLSHDGCIQLIKINDYNNGVDHLSAKVIISSLDGNILTNEQGGLYVSNKASNIKLNDGSSVSDSINELNNKIDNISKSYAMDVNDSVTVDLTKRVMDTGGFVISADVNLAKSKNNIIRKDGDGLYSNVDMSYSTNNNTLSFYVNGVKKYDFALNSVSTIDTITYDGNTNEIVIKYLSNGEIKETRFSASNLFKPIVVNNDGHNTILSINESDSYVLSADVDLVNLIDNTDKSVKLDINENGKITAKVNISTLPDNILTVDNNYNLYVKGGLDEITADKVIMLNKQYGDNVENAIDTLGDMIDDFKDSISGDFSEEINKLKSKTNINVIDTKTIDLRFSSTENTSELEANVILSSNNNLLTLDNGILFDGNIDYSTFNNENLNRSIQLKRNETPFNSKSEALTYLNNSEFLTNKKDGEPLIVKYLENNKLNILYGIVSEDSYGVKTINIIDNVGTIIDKVEYHAEATSITTSDSYGTETITDVIAKSLYFEYTDASCLKHTFVVPLEKVIADYEYPTQNDMYNGATNTISDGLSVKEYHNIKFDVEIDEKGKSTMKADLEYMDCGEY